MKKASSGFDDMDTATIDRVIEMAWEDRTPFEAIEWQFGLSEENVITLMRTYMHPSNFKRWRKRVQGRNTKHTYIRNAETLRFKSNMQRVISQNKISKR